MKELVGVSKSPSYQGFEGYGSGLWVGAWRGLGARFEGIFGKGFGGVVGGSLEGGV